LHVQLTDKLRQYRLYVDGINFDDIADTPTELESRRQQLTQFEATFEASCVYLFN